MQESFTDAFVCSLAAALRHVLEHGRGVASQDKTLHGSGVVNEQQSNARERGGEGEGGNKDTGSQFGVKSEIVSGGRAKGSGDDVSVTVILGRELQRERERMDGAAVGVAQELLLQAGRQADGVVGVTRQERSRKLQAWSQLDSLNLEADTGAIQAKGSEGGREGEEESRAVQAVEGENRGEEDGGREATEGGSGKKKKKKKQKKRKDGVVETVIGEEGEENGVIRSISEKERREGVECEHSHTTNDHATRNPKPSRGWEDQVIGGLQRVRQHVILLQSYVPPQFFAVKDVQQLTAALLQAEV